MTRQRDYQSTFEVALYKAGENKEGVIRTLVALGWFNVEEAINIVNDLPRQISECLSSEEAGNAVLSLQESGAVAGMDRCIEFD